MQRNERFKGYSHWNMYGYKSTAPSKPELSGPMEEGKLQEGNITGPELSHPLEERDIQEGNITTSDSDQKKGVFKDPTENNDTFSQDDIGGIE